MSNRSNSKKAVLRVSLMAASVVLAMPMMAQRTVEKPISPTHFQNMEKTLPLMARVSATAESIDALREVRAAITDWHQRQDSAGSWGRLSGATVQWLSTLTNAHPEASGIVSAMLRRASGPQGLIRVTAIAINATNEGVLLAPNNEMAMRLAQRVKTVVESNKEVLYTGSASSSALERMDRAASAVIANGLDDERKSAELLSSVIAFYRAATSDSGEQIALGSNLGQIVLESTEHRSTQVELSPSVGNPPVVVSPYDVRMCAPCQAGHFGTNCDLLCGSACSDPCYKQCNADYDTQEGSCAAIFGRSKLNPLYLSCVGLAMVQFSGCALVCDACPSCP